MQRAPAATGLRRSDGGWPWREAAVVLDCLEWLFPCPAEVATAEGARRPSESRGWSPFESVKRCLLLWPCPSVIAPLHELRRGF